MTLWPWADPLPYAACLLAAWAWDRWLGEPPNAAHPVVWMGRAIGWMRRRAPRAGRGPRFVWGLAMALLLPAGSAAVGLVVLLPWAGPLLAVFLMKGAWSARALTAAGLRVADALDAGDLPAARAGLGWLCSRDPAALGPADLAAAATESVAENASDSLVAPLLWLALGGVPALLAYRCVNTLDAMVGYRGELEWLGKASARLDDLLNLVPARLTALLLLLVGAATPGASARRGLAVLRADRGRTASPNAGWPMAAMAGLVGCALAKAGHYTLGGGQPPCTAAALRRACVLSERAMAAALLGLCVAWVAAA